MTGDRQLMRLMVVSFFALLGEFFIMMAIEGLFDLTIGTPGEITRVIFIQASDYPVEAGVTSDALLMWVVMVIFFGLMFAVTIWMIIFMPSDPEPW